MQLYIKKLKRTNFFEEFFLGGGGLAMSFSDYYGRTAHSYIILQSFRNNNINE